MGNTPQGRLQVAGYRGWLPPNDDYKRGTIGKPLKDIIIEIHDENHTSLPEGEIGEIAVSGSTVMEGYFTRDEKDSNGQKESARSLISELFAYLCGCLPKGSLDFIYWEV